MALSVALPDHFRRKGRNNFPSFYFITPCVSAGCNRFDIVCVCVREHVCVCVCVGLWRQGCQKEPASAATPPNNCPSTDPPNNIFKFSPLLHLGEICGFNLIWKQSCAHTALLGPMGHFFTKKKQQKIVGPFWHGANFSDKQSEWAGNRIPCGKIWSMCMK